MEVAPSERQLETILHQMRTEARRFEDEMADYAHGETRSYGFDSETERYICERTDTVVGSYHRVDPLTERELREILRQFSVRTFERQGFEGLI